MMIQAAAPAPAASGRARTATGGSTGSFACYGVLVSDNEDSPPCKTTLTTEPFESIASTTTTHGTSEPNHQFHEVSSMRIDKDQELSVARQQARDAQHALDRLAEGVRILTRQLKRIHQDDDHVVVRRSSGGGGVGCHHHQHPQHDDDDDDNNSSSPHRGNSRRDDQSRLEALLMQHPATTANRHHHNGSSSNDCTTPTNTSTSSTTTTFAHTATTTTNTDALLLALADATHMALEHAQMASHEADVLVQDVQDAQETCRRALQRALASRRQVQSLESQVAFQTRQGQKAKTERKLLIRQVKLLRKENAALQQRQKQEQLRAMELHVAKALCIHEGLIMSGRKQTKAEVVETKGNPCVSDDDDDDDDDHFSCSLHLDESSVETEECSNVGSNVGETKGEDSKHFAIGQENKRSLSPMAERLQTTPLGRALGFTFKSWSSPSKETATTSCKKQVGNGSDNDEKADTQSTHSEKENAMLFPVASIPAAAAYVPLKFNSHARPVTPVSPSPRASDGSKQNTTWTDDLTPSSGVRHFFQRPASCHQTRRSLLELNEVPVLVGRSSNKSVHKLPRSDSMTIQRSWSGERHTPTEGLPQGVVAMRNDDSPVGVSPLDVESVCDGDLLLDAEAVRSLSLPRIIDSDSFAVPDIGLPKVNPRPESLCPPEVEQIVQEIGTLYEC